MASHRVEVRLSPPLRRRLEQLAEERNTSLSGAVRSAVLEATRADRGIPSKEELLVLLSEAARTGSIVAMNELLRYYDHQGPGRKQHPLDGFDELAARRDR